MFDLYPAYISPYIFDIPLYPCPYLYLASFAADPLYPIVSHCFQLYPYVSSCIQLYPAVSHRVSPPRKRDMTKNTLPGRATVRLKKTQVTHTHTTNNPTNKTNEHTHKNTRHAHFSLYKILFHFKALFWQSIILLCPSQLKNLPYCITIARPLRNIRPPTDPYFLCHTPYNISDGNIV